MIDICVNRALFIFFKYFSMKYWKCFAWINLKLVSYSGFVYVQLISD